MEVVRVAHYICIFWPLYVSRKLSLYAPSRFLIIYFCIYSL